MDVIQKDINQSAVARLGRNNLGVMRFPMEVLTGLRTHSLFICPAPLRVYGEMKVLDEGKANQIANVEMLHVALEEFHKEVLEINRLHRSRAQLINNAKNNIIPMNYSVGDYVLVRIHANRQHKLQFRWQRARCMKEARPKLVFVVKDLAQNQQLTVRAQCMVVYPVTRSCANGSNELKRQAAYYDNTHHLLDDIGGIRKRNGLFRMRIKWSGLKTLRI